MITYDVCCSQVIGDIFNLPQINMTAGETQTVIFNLLTPEGKPFDGADTCEANFALVEYHNRLSDPLINKNIEITYDVDGYDNVAIVKFDINDTLNLAGKYVYQLSLKSSSGDYDVVGHGFLYLVRNICPSFASA